jgi:hypothetical protein
VNGPVSATRLSTRSRSHGLRARGCPTYGARLGRLSPRRPRPTHPHHPLAHALPLFLAAGFC